MGSALGENRAGTAHSLGSRLARLTGRSALALGVEEGLGILAAAGALELPVPDVSVGPGKPGNIGHVVLLPSSCV